VDLGIAKGPSAGRLLKQIKKHPKIWALWLTPVIPATWETEVGRLRSEASPRQKSMSSYLKNN
jgi:hypothetical protein